VQARSIIEAETARDFIKSLRHRPAYNVRVYEIEGGYSVNYYKGQDRGEAERAFVSAFNQRRRSGGEWRVQMLLGRRKLAELSYSNYDNELVGQLNRGVSPIQALQDFRRREREYDQMLRSIKKAVPATGKVERSPWGETTRHTPQELERMQQLHAKKLRQLRAAHRPGCQCAFCTEPYYNDPFFM